MLMGYDLCLTSDWKNNTKDKSISSERQSFTKVNNSLTSPSRWTHQLYFETYITVSCKLPLHLINTTQLYSYHKLQ